MTSIIHASEGIGALQQQMTRVIMAGKRLCAGHARPHAPSGLNWKGTAMQMGYSQTRQAVWRTTSVSWARTTVLL
eukprot:1743573-Rhodomonas_salina.1